MTSIKIKSDGNGYNTTVIDAATNMPIGHVRKITWSCDVNQNMGLPLCTIEIIGVPLEATVLNANINKKQSPMLLSSNSEFNNADRAQLCLKLARNMAYTEESDVFEQANKLMSLPDADLDTLNRFSESIYPSQKSYKKEKKPRCEHCER